VEGLNSRLRHLHMLLHLLTISLSVFASPPAGACSGPVDCNARECIDCTCTDGHCSCADGWSGPNCETPFCTNRTAGCSGHGSCSQSATSITCSCDDGWTGPRCAVKACNLTCSHGGHCNKEGTQCIGCLGAWSGPTCGAWNSSYPASLLTERLVVLKNQSVAMLQSQLKYNPICRTNQECVGWGVDATTGKLAQFPMLSLNFSGQGQVWEGYTAAYGTNVAGHDPSTSAFSHDTEAFPTIEDLLDYVDSLRASQPYQGVCEC
jgi:hypothetical protein